MSAGLCQTCRHSKRLSSAKGSEFWMCTRSEHDSAFVRYPRLPVLRCSGYEANDKEQPPRARETNV